MEGVIMICPKCHHENPEGANFCSECGQELPDTANFTDREANESHSLFYQFAHRINHAAGIRNPSEMKLRGLFSQVRRRHSNLEAERLFIVGTALTTPDIEEVADTWPRPWLFARVLFVAVLVFAGLYIGLNIFGNVNLLPGLIVTGPFMIPLCLLIFFWEMNAPQNVPIYKVIYMFFFGGILSLLTALMLYQGFQYRGEWSLVPGLVEELAKILIVIGFLRKRRFKYILNVMIRAGLKQIAGIKEQASHSEYVPGPLPFNTSSMVK
jgi:RsiW-degrading membrane proteinase PrsW (M82 family)